MTIQSIALQYMKYLIANGYSAELAWSKAMQLIEGGSKK